MDLLCIHFLNLVGFTSSFYILHRHGFWLRTNFYNVYSWLLCPIPCVSIGRRIMFLKALYFHGHITSSHNPCKWPYDTHAFNCPLLFILPSLHVCIALFPNTLTLSLPPLYLLLELPHTILLLAHLPSSLTHFKHYMAFCHSSIDVSSKQWIPSQNCLWCDIQDGEHKTEEDGRRIWGYGEFRDHSETQ